MAMRDQIHRRRAMAAWGSTAVSGPNVDVPERSTIFSSRSPPRAP